jgi:RHS repeat-associated protein
MNAYRFGFNGQEKDDEIKGNGNSYDFGARMLDPRIGRWLALDPLAARYTSLSPYNFVANSPLAFIDPDGKRIKPHSSKDKAKILGFLTKEFGDKRLFAFNEKSELYMDPSRYKLLMKQNKLTANDIEQLAAISQMAADPAVIKVAVTANENEERLSEVNTRMVGGHEIVEVEKSNANFEGVTIENFDVNIAGDDELLIIINEKASSEGMFTAIIDLNKGLTGDGKGMGFDKASIPAVKSTPSSTFIHELLDHGLDWIKTGSLNDDHKSQTEKVKYQNQSLEKTGPLQRDGNDHE